MVLTNFLNKEDGINWLAGTHNILLAAGLAARKAERRPTVSGRRAGAGAEGAV